MAINTYQSIFAEIADFIVSQPSLEAIAEYRASQPLQQHLDNLLEKNHEEGLAPDEREELDKILAVSQVMTLAKVKARLKSTKVEQV